MSGPPRAPRRSLAGPHLTIPVDPNHDHILGSPSAHMTLVEYGDYECPFCGEAYPIVKQVQATLGSQLRFVFRNFPLTEMHPNAQFAAELAEAGGVQGKFWELHDFIYEHQSELSDPRRFTLLASKATNLEVEMVRRQLAEHAYLRRIREDFMGGVHSGVNGTPTFYINGLRHDGGFELPTMIEALRSPR
ncbi:MAG: DsbA family protein [Thermoplasmata archaeon]|nr:DsbA family protein [Thermoplasmata archaeon]